MIEFMILFIFLILLTNVISILEYSIYKKSYRNLQYMYFRKNDNMLIANENAKDEFVIFSEWRFTIYPKKFLQFDIWKIIDLHKFYWLIKFRSRIKKMKLIEKKTYTHYDY